MCIWICCCEIYFIELPFNIFSYSSAFFSSLSVWPEYRAVTERWSFGSLWPSLLSRLIKTMSRNWSGCCARIRAMWTILIAMFVQCPADGRLLIFHWCLFNCVPTGKVLRVGMGLQVWKDRLRSCNLQICRNWQASWLGKCFSEKIAVNCLCDCLRGCCCT